MKQHDRETLLQQNQNLYFHTAVKWNYPQYLKTIQDWFNSLSVFPAYNNLIPLNDMVCKQVKLVTSKDLQDYDSF